MAHGQAMISTATAAAKARTAGAWHPATAATNQTTNVAMAIEITTGTKTPLIRSASRWIGAREPCASRISLHDLREHAVARRASWRGSGSAPVRLIVPPITRSPGRLRRPASTRR